jgi:hypothetical protein
VRGPGWREYTPKTAYNAFAEGAKKTVHI